MTNPHASETRNPEDFTIDEIDELADTIAIAAAHIDAAIHRLLTHIREFDACGGWAVHGATSCVHWLAFRIGLSPGAAREKLRVARALAELPLVDDALRRGQISYSKVRAITRVATPNTKEALVQMAISMTAAQLERTVRLWRQQAQAGPASPEIEAERRFVRYRETDDGMVVIEAWLHPDEAETVRRAIDGRVAPGPPPGLPQVRTCGFPASGSSEQGFAAFR